jgi:hypothetical protein
VAQLRYSETKSYTEQHPIFDGAFMVTEQTHPGMFGSLELGSRQKKNMYAKH